MLQVSLIDGFAPAVGDSFDILDSDTLSGTFHQLVLPALGQLNWDTSQLYTSGTLSVVLPGDFNLDGTVDAADYTVWRDGLGGTYTAADYSIWRANFGATANASLGNSSASVPEPHALALTMTTVLMSLGLSQRSPRYRVER